MMIRVRSPGHVPTRDPSHRVGVVFMLDADSLSQSGIVESRDVPRRKNIWLICAKHFVHDDSILDTKAGLLCQFDIWSNSESCHYAIRSDFQSRFGAHIQLIASPADFNRGIS